LAQTNRNNMIDNQSAEEQSLAISAKPIQGINLEFLWIPTELARKPEIDWTVKPLIALAGTAAEKTTGFKGIVATDQELAKFLQLSSPRQVQKVIQRGINTRWLARQQLKQRLLHASISRRCTTGIKIPRNVIDSPSLTWPKKALYSLIAGIAKGRKHQCFASNAWLGKALGLSACYVRELISELVQAGFIVAQHGQRSRYLRANSDLPVPKVGEKPLSAMALEAAPDSPGAAPLPPSNGPTTAPIRIMNIKESKEIFPAAPENFLFEEKKLQASEETLTTTFTNLIDESLTAIQSTEIQNAVSQTTSTIPPTSMEIHWDPKTDFEWQYKQLLSVMKGGYSAMQQAQVIARRKDLIIEDKVLREFCSNQFQGGLVKINPSHQRLDFTQEVGDFLWMVFKSWFGMGQIGQEHSSSPEKYNVWLITKNTNELSKFITRYPKICQQLRKQTEWDGAIDNITQPVRNQVLFNWWRHNWSKRWNPSGNVLFAEIPQAILDYRQLQQVRLEFNMNRRDVMAQYQANKQKPIPELLHEGATQVNPSWSISFAWLMLHTAGLHQEAQPYEAEVMDGFKCRPEVLQVYRECAPEVMKKILANAG